MMQTNEESKHQHVCPNDKLDWQTLICKYCTPRVSTHCKLLMILLTLTFLLGLIVVVYSSAQYVEIWLSRLDDSTVFWLLY